MLKNYLAYNLIDDAFTTLTSQASKYPDEGFLDRIESVRTEFRYMSEYFVKGIQDPKRGEMYEAMKLKLRGIGYDLAMRENIEKNAFLKPWISRLRMTDTSLDALDTIDAELAFYAVMLSYHWRDEDIDSWVNYLSVASLRRSMLLSALTLSAVMQESVHKMICLARIYNKAEDTVVRQRALVGCVISLAAHCRSCSDAVRCAVLDELVQSPETITEIIELQMQLVNCTQADADASRINKTIMPEILKNQPFTVTKNGIKERDENEEELDPEDADSRIDELEKNIRKVQKMQQQGSDIFFGGFKQMKRYPFFNKVSNWLTPFSFSHPDIASVREKLDGSKFLHRVVEKGPFCDSDKYSFVFAMNEVMDHFSDKIKGLMEEGDLGPIGMHDDISETLQPSYVRRQYLQDLFRFYSLNSMAKTLTNPFSTAESFDIWLACADILLPKHVMEMGKYLIRKKYLLPLEDLINVYPKQDAVELDYLSGELFLSNALNSSYLADRNQTLKDAIEYFNSYLQDHPNHQPSMRGMAKAYYNLGDYEKAAFYYDALRTLSPERQSYNVNYFMAMVKSGQAETVLPDLYRMNYEHPDDYSIANTLGWSLLYAEKPDKALAVYEKIPQEVLTTDLSIYLNYVYAYFVTQCHMPSVTFANKTESHSALLLSEMRSDADMLALYGIRESEMGIMAHCL